MARQAWFEPNSGELLFDRYAQTMNSWQEAMEDGIVTAEELITQHQRVIALLKQVEPKLDDDAHELVTETFFEMAVFYGLQSIHVLQELGELRDLQGQGA